MNSGQSCHSPTRILVHEDDAPAFHDLLAAEAAKVRVGDPLDPATTMGPLVNRTQFDRVRRYIDIGVG